MILKGMRKLNKPHPYSLPAREGDQIEFQAIDLQYLDKIVFYCQGIEDE